MKTYVLTVSRNFPKTHSKAGKSTFFISQIRHSTCNHLAVSGSKIGMCCQNCDYEFECAITKKIHTIRSNAKLWEKRISEIQKGNAILSIRYWSDKPYSSKQVEICQLDKNSGIGTQFLYFDSVTLCEGKETPLYATVYEPFKYKFSPNLKDLASNDGLSVEDFKEWFKKPLLGDFLIIHFTSFRY
jgi:hypothetical protein